MLCSFDSDLRAEMARQAQRPEDASAIGLVEIEAARLLDGDFDPLAPPILRVAETSGHHECRSNAQRLREGRHEHAGQTPEALTVSYWQRQHSAAPRTSLIGLWLEMT